MSLDRRQCQRCGLACGFTDDRCDHCCYHQTVAETAVAMSQPGTIFRLAEESQASWEERKRAQQAEEQAAYRAVYQRILGRLAPDQGEPTVDRLREEHDQLWRRAARLETIAKQSAAERTCLIERIEAARDQFKTITSDFPGLTGPLIDLFTDGERGGV